MTQMPKKEFPGLTLVSREAITELAVEIAPMVEGLDVLGDFPDSANISPKLTIGQLRRLARALDKLRP